MEPLDYADARRHALVRAAVELGVPGDEAPALVERVLAQQVRRIRRAEDPDPLVHRALEAAVRRRGGPSPGDADHGADGCGRSRGGWRAYAALLFAIAAAAVAAAALRPDRPPADHLRADQVPSLFGYDVGSARRLLAARGLDVSVTPVRSCEILGRAVGADPPTGATVHPGDPVTVFAAIPANVACLSDYQERSSAWRFLDFASDHAPAPPFARRVRVFRDGADPVVLHRHEATDPTAWETTGVLSALRDAAGVVVLTQDQPVTYATPRLDVVPVTDRRACGGRIASAVPRLPGISFVLRAPVRGACLVRVDLLRATHDPTGPIAAVALHTGGG